MQQLISADKLMTLLSVHATENEAPIYDYMHMYLWIKNF